MTKDEAVNIVMKARGYILHDINGETAITKLWLQQGDSIGKTPEMAAQECKDLNILAEVCLNNSTNLKNLLVPLGLDIASFRYKRIDQIKECALFSTAEALQESRGDSKCHTEKT